MEVNTSLSGKPLSRAAMSPFFSGRDGCGGGSTLVVDNRTSELASTAQELRVSHHIHVDTSGESTGPWISMTMLI